MTELEQLRHALQVCQAQRNRAQDELIDVQVQAVMKIAELTAKIEAKAQPTKQQKT